MKIVLQRVRRAKVSVEGEITGEIGTGLVLLVGVGPEDTGETAERLADKIGRLRIFTDSEGKTNLSLQDTGGAILVVSQFTLYADCRKGNRPSFTGAASPDVARTVYEYFIECCRGICSHTACGRFGADMQVELVGDGPFTLVLEA